MTTPLHRPQLFILVIFLWVMSSQNSLAQANFQLQSSPLSSEIHGKTITVIYTDRSENLWVGTQSGLYHFDGANVHSYSASEEARYRLPVSDIRGISEDINGNLVLATYGGGVSVWDTSANAFRRINNKRLDGYEYLIGLTKDTDGNFFLHTSSETLIANNSVTDFYTLSAKFPDISNTRLATISLSLSTGEVLIFSSNKFYIVDASTETSREISLDTSNYQVSTLTMIDVDNTVFGTESGELLLIDTTNWSIKKITTLSPGKSTTITDIVKYNDQLWVGSDNGLHITDLNLNTVYHFDRTNSQLASDHITTLYPLEDYLFVGTYNGLDQTKFAPFELRNSRNSGVYNDVMAIEEDRKGTIWVGTFDGVFRYKRSTSNHLRLTSKSSIQLPDERAMSIEAAGEFIWIGYWKNGVAILNVENREILPLPYPELSEISVTKILSQDNGAIWIATYNQGIFKIHEDTIQRYLELSDRAVIALTLSKTGMLYAVSEKAVLVYDSNSDTFLEQPIKYPGNLQDVVLLTLNANKNDIFYLGTKDHGVFELRESDSKEFTFLARGFGEDSSLSASSVYSILLDKRSNFWLSTSIGIAHLDEYGRLISRFDKSDGLQGSDFSFGAYLQSSDGAIFFGGPNGYNKFYPSEIQINHSAPTITVPSVKIGSNEHLTYTDVQNFAQFQISYRNQGITISIGLLDFTNPDQNRYTHILEGQDPSWVDDGTNNTFTYTNLEPGDYVFRAKGANSAGIWSENGVSLRIQVLPPWWRTWWAYCLYLVSILIVTWGAMRVYRTHLLKEEAVKSAIEMQDAADRAHDELQESQEFQDDLVRAVHQHNLATLDLISSYLEPAGTAELTKSKILGHLKAMELLEKCYYFQENMLMADVHSYVDGLIEHLLQTEQIVPATTTTINITTSELLPANVASPAAVILYELLENACLHAFSDDSAANFIEVRGEITQSQHNKQILLLTVSDDGMGFPSKTWGESDGHVGLKVVHSLAESMNGDVTISHTEGAQIKVSLPFTD